MTLAEQESLVAPKRHRWTIDDFFREADAGIFDTQPVELIEGELIDMQAQNDPHTWTISRLVRGMVSLFPDPYWIKIQATQRLSEFSGPEPDVTTSRCLACIKSSSRWPGLIWFWKSRSSSADERAVYSTQPQSRLYS